MYLDRLLFSLKTHNNRTGLTNNLKLKTRANYSASERPSRAINSLTAA